MIVKHDFYRSEGRNANKTNDQVRLTIDLHRIEGMKLKKHIEKLIFISGELVEKKDSVNE